MSENPLSQELLDILACPKCKSAVELTGKADGLICRQCQVVYEIRDGIPIMLIDEAISLEEYRSGGRGWKSGQAAER